MNGFHIWKNSPSRLRRQIPLFVTYGDIFPRSGEAFLWDGAFGMVVQFPAQVQSVRLRQRLPPRGSWHAVRRD